MQNIDFQARKHRDFLRKFRYFLDWNWIFRFQWTGLDRLIDSSSENVDSPPSIGLWDGPPPDPAEKSAWNFKSGSIVADRALLFAGINLILGAYMHNEFKSNGKCVDVYMPTNNKARRVYRKGKLQDFGGSTRVLFNQSMLNSKYVQ